MTPTGWLALAGLAAGSALPSRVHARASELAVSGRLARPGRGGRGHGRATLSGAGVSTRLVPAIGAGVGAAATAAVCWRYGAALAVAAAAVLLLGAVLGRDVVRGRGERRRRRELLVAVRLLAAELAAGVSPAAALTASASAGTGASQVLAAAGRAQAGGADAADVMLRPRPGDDSLRGLAVAWRLAETTGAPLAGVVERVAADLSAAETRRQAVAVVLAGPRSSAALLAGLPALGVGLGAAMGARPLGLLLGESAGRALCCAGVLLDVGGVLWLRRIVRRAARA